MKMLHVGVIGTGFIGKQHIEAIRRIPGTEVAAIADSSSSMGQSAGEQLCIEKVYQDYHDLLNDSTIDIVHNCTPSSLHFEINREIIKSGKHVYCEKPLTIRSQESQVLAELADQMDVATGVNFNYRHNAMVQEMRQRVKNGSIGKPLMVHGQYLQDWLLYETDYDWRMDPKIGGSSRAVADIGSHCFDTAQFVLDRKITSVYAHLITVYPTRKRCEKAGDTFSSKVGRVIEELSIHSEDAAFIMVKFEDGTSGLFHLSQVCAGKKNGLELNVSASEASLEWKQETADRLWIGHRDTPNESIYADAKFLTDDARSYATLPAGHAVAWHDALRNAINSFYKSIRNSTYREPSQNYATFRDGIQIMKLVEACLLSNELDQWVQIK